MARTRTMLVALAGAAFVGCSEATAPTAAPPIAVSAALAPDAARLSAILLDDAAERAVAGLDDASVAADLRGRLASIAAATAAGDGRAAARALPAARATLARYAERAAPADAADRDVIALALDAVERLLRDAPTQ